MSRWNNVMNCKRNGLFSNSQIPIYLLSIVKWLVSDSVETHCNRFYICHKLDQSRAVGKRTVHQMIDS